MVTVVPEGRKAVLLSLLTRVMLSHDRWRRSFVRPGRTSGEKHPLQTEAEILQSRSQTHDNVVAETGEERAAWYEVVIASKQARDTVLPLLGCFGSRGCNVNMRNRQKL